MTARREGEIDPIERGRKNSVSATRGHSTDTPGCSSMHASQPQASHPHTVSTVTEDTSGLTQVLQSVRGSPLNILAVCATMRKAKLPRLNPTLSAVCSAREQTGDDEGACTGSLSQSNADTPPSSPTSVSSFPRAPINSSPALTVASPSYANKMSEKPTSPTVHASSRTASPSQIPSAPDEPRKLRSAHSRQDATAQSDLRPLPHACRNWNVESAPPAPANEEWILANRPWTLREAYLLAFVATLCPHEGPPEEYWPAVCDLYNYMLMFPLLHAWVARTEEEAGIDRGDAPRSRRVFWEAFFRELCAHWRGSYDVGPQSRKLQHLAEAFLNMCVKKAREEVEMRTPTGALWNVAGGARDGSAGPSDGDQYEWQMLGSMDAFKPGEDGWYDVALPAPPLVYSSSRTWPWAHAWMGLVSSALGGDFRTRRSTVEVFGRVYELLGPLYPRRTPWECWYRWAVSGAKVSRGGDCTIEHAYNGSILIRSVGDEMEEHRGAADSSEAESAVSIGQTAVANTSLGASDKVQNGRTDTTAAVEGKHEESNREKEEVDNESQTVEATYNERLRCLPISATH